MIEGEYRRLLKILTVRACRVLRVATSRGDDWVLGESGKSPADFAAETLIRWGTNQLQFSGPPEALPGFLMTVMTNAIISTLRKKAVKTAGAARRRWPTSSPKTPLFNRSRRASSISVRCCATGRFARRWINAP